MHNITMYDMLYYYYYCKNEIYILNCKTTLVFQRLCYMISRVLCFSGGCSERCALLRHLQHWSLTAERIKGKGSCVYICSYLAVFSKATTSLSLMHGLDSKSNKVLKLLHISFIAFRFYHYCHSQQNYVMILLKLRDIFCPFW